MACWDSAWRCIAIAGVIPPVLVTATMAAPNDRPRIFAAEIRRLLRFAEHPELADRFDLSSETLEDPEAKVPIDVWYDIVEAATAATGDPYLGLHFGSQSLAGYRDNAGPVGLLILASDSLRVAFDRTLRYQKYWNEAERYEIVERDGRYTVRYMPWGPPRPAHVQLAEKTAAQVVRFVRGAVRGCVPEALRLPHGVRPGSEEIARILGREPSFGAAATEIVLASSVLDARLPTADAALFRVLDRSLAEQIRGVSRDSNVADRARKAIADYLHREELSIDMVARVIGTSERTLQRRLTRERTSFRDLVDEIRRSRALALLKEDASVAELAFMLGYAEETAFYRAFRRWTGSTPESWRSNDPRGTGTNVSPAPTRSSR
jgi:AraC-like DNA-binding protein